MIKVGQIEKEIKDSTWPMRCKGSAWDRFGRWYSDREQHRLDLITLVKDVDLEKAVMSLDWTKPIQTRSGVPAELVTTLEGQPRSHVVKYIHDNRACVSQVFPSGHIQHVGVERKEDIINVPPPPPKTYELWLNVYPVDSGCFNYTHETRAYADQQADVNRVACLKVTYTHGEGLDDES